MGSKVKPRHGEDRQPRKCGKKIIPLRSKSDKEVVPLRTDYSYPDPEWDRDTYWTANR